MTQSIRPDDPRLGWPGAISVNHSAEWSEPWRLPYADRALFPPQVLQERAEMPSGVRLTFVSDTTLVTGSLAEPYPETSPLDLYCDGAFVASLPLDGQDGQERRFRFEGLDAGPKLVELWLPQFGWFRLRELLLSDGATLFAHRDTRPRWINYGSSISQCRGAESPSQTWPAVVARALDLNLTNLGVGGQCHFDIMVARMIRDQPADLITLNLGINVQGGASLNARTFRPAVIGFVKTVRDGHPDTPIIVRSPIISPPREDTPNVVGLSLNMIRYEVKTAVKTLQSYGDAHLIYVDGTTVFGEAHLDLLPDELHPNAEGYKVMGKNYVQVIQELGVL